MKGLITTLKQFEEFTNLLDPNSEIAADVETYKTRPTQAGARLLGLALSGLTQTGEVESAYVSFTHYDKVLEGFVIKAAFFEEIGKFLTTRKLVGWNVPFDKMWLDHALKFKTEWHADGRILWHLQNNDPAVRGFGLKMAQKLLLNWKEANDTALEEHVKMAGGKLANGDHYLADLDMLARYACLDTDSTLRVYLKLKPFMDQHSYWGFAKQILEYAVLLSEASAQGLPADEVKLLHASALYDKKRGMAAKQILEVCEKEIKAIEHTWKVEKASQYKREVNREKFLSTPRLWRKFNPSSSQQRETLLHTMLEFPVKETTPTGRAKTDRANLAGIPHAGAKILIEYSEFKKIAEQARTYLHAVEDGAIYTSYDVCGTVSGRLAGFKPSVLNMPFSETDVMSAFPVTPGFIGIHADLSSIEPCVLAHYSEDPTLLKVYKYGQGDIYLDLAVDIFAERSDLLSNYNPKSTDFKEAKKAFKDLRDICKTIHLAVSYTGTHVTIAKNLTKQGYPTSKGRAMQLVGLYWKKFARVKAFSQRLQEVYDDKGFIRNLVGRIIQVPHIYKKDLMNRLVQSSAHDILRLWVTEIIKEFAIRGVEWRHWLPDLHDSTTFMVKRGQEEAAKSAYLVALETVQKQLNLSVPLKCELKFVETLAGVKENE